MHQLFHHHTITNIFSSYFGIDRARPMPEVFKYIEVSLEYREYRKPKKLFPLKAAHFLLKTPQSMQIFDLKMLYPAIFQIVF